MQTIKLVEYSFDEKGKRDVKQILYIEASNVLVVQFKRGENESLGEFIENFRGMDGGDAFHFNPNGESWSIIQLGYFNYKGEYHITFVYHCCDIYIMSDTGKTIDKISV